MKRTWITVFILLLAFQSQDTLSVSSAEFQKYINRYGTSQLIDVRTPQEYHAGHIPGAKLVNLYDPTFKTKILSLNLDKNKPVLVYCRSGNRSLVAARFLNEKGYKVINLKYGIKQWIKEQRPIEK
jgi:rhodanese-related sulfurtransferase